MMTAWKSVVGTDDTVLNGGDVALAGDVGDHPLGDKLALDVSANHVHSSLARQLFGNGHIERAARLRVPLPFGRFDLVPEGRAVVDPAGRARWREDLGRGHDAGPAPVIVDLAGALVDEALAGAVGGARYGLVSRPRCGSGTVSLRSSVLWPQMRPHSVLGLVKRCTHRSGGGTFPCARAPENLLIDQGSEVVPQVPHELPSWGDGHHPVFCARRPSHAGAS